MHEAGDASGEAAAGTTGGLVTMMKALPPGNAPAAAPAAWLLVL